MGYRHYLGYIKKSDYDNFASELKDISQKIAELGSIETEEAEDKSDKLYNRKWELIKENVHIISEFGKLYYGNTQSIYDCLYKNKKTDLLSKDDDDELFVVEQKDFILKCAVATYQCWAEALKDIMQDPNRTKAFFEEQIDVFDHVFDKDGNLTFFANYIVNDNQFNFEAYKLIQLHKDFDYENNILIIRAY